MPPAKLQKQADVVPIRFEPPSGYIEASGKPMAYWLPKGKTPASIGLNAETVSATDGKNGDCCPF